MKNKLSVICIILTMFPIVLPFYAYAEGLIYGKPYSDALSEDFYNLAIGFAEGDSAANVTQNLILPTVGANGSQISWDSSNENVISDTGVVTRQESITQIKIKADVSRDGETVDRHFALLVVPNTVDSLNTIQQTFAGATNLNPISAAAMITSMVRIIGANEPYEGDIQILSDQMSYMDPSDVESVATAFKNMSNSSQSIVVNALNFLSGANTLPPGDTSGFEGILKRLNKEFGALENDDSGSASYLKILKFLQSVTSDNQLSTNLNMEPEIRTFITTTLNYSLNRDGAINSILNQSNGNDILEKFNNYMIDIVREYPSELDAVKNYLSANGINTGNLLDAVSAHTVTYDGNGSTGGSVPTDSNTYEQGTTVTVSDNTGDLVKTGYTFAGWNTQADGSGTDYATNASFNMGAANVTLYAKWTEILLGDLGDVNLDGKITPTDALFVYQFIKNKRTLTADQQYAAKVDNDDQITVADAGLILAKYIGEILTFPMEE